MNLRELRAPMALKISVLSSVLSLLAIGIVGLISYQRILRGSIEPLLGKRLDYTARGIALRLSGADLLELQKSEQTGTPNGGTRSEDLTATQKYKDIHRALILAKRQNELENDIKIYVRDPETPEKLRVVISSSEEPTVWQSQSSDRFFDSVLKDGLPIHTSIYKQGESQWISGLSPIESEKGDLIGILRIDYRADDEIKSAEGDVLKSLEVAAILAFLVSTTISLIASRRLSRPLRDLSRAAKEIGQGNLNPQISVTIRDEIGDLAKSFVSMTNEIRMGREKLEEYNRNLEKTVTERTAELSDAKEKISAMIDSLDEGFFMFGHDGICLPFYAKACLRLLEQAPAGKPIEAVLSVAQGSLREWLEIAFADRIPFGGIADLAPSSVPNGAGKIVKLSYHPIRDQEGKIKYIVGLVQDITAQVQAEKAAESERKFSKLVVTLIENKDQFVDFVGECESNFKSATDQVRVAGRDARVAVMRTLHTLKGGAGMFHLNEVQQLAHQAETEIIENRTASAEALTQQVNRARVALVENVSKYSKILGFDPFDADRMITVKESAIIKLREHPVMLRMVRDDFKDEFDQTLLFQRVDQAFSQYNLVVKQAADKLGKLVEDIHFVNGDLRFYLGPFRPLFGACVHAFRNAVDHGLELPEERLDTGKLEAGRIEVVFSQLRDSGELSIEIRDDGRGISDEAVRKKLRSLTPNHPLLNAEYDKLIQVLFESGFSTKEQVSDLSGRGVGLDAIRYEADRLGGRAWISSNPGHGSSIHIRVPMEREQTASESYNFAKNYPRIKNS